MVVSALISMWVMNTSTTLMLLPIGLAVCSSVAESMPDFSSKEKRAFEISLLLGIAYAATIGGMSTLVGTAPNIIFVGFMQDFNIPFVLAFICQLDESSSATLFNYACFVMVCVNKNCLPG